MSNSRLREISEFLGHSNVGSPRDDQDLIKQIRRGFSIGAIEKVRRSSGMQGDQIRMAIGVSPRTFARLKVAKEKQRLKQDVSERLFRFSSIVVHSADTFGSVENACEWVLRENRALGGQRPIDMIDTAIGFHQVMDVLGRLEHGVFS